MNPDTKRLPEIDMLRGIALLGIFLMNIDFMSKSNLVDAWQDGFINWYDHSAGKLKFLVLAQRFIGIFSLLFGLNIAIQKKNFENDPASFKAYYLKRVGVLSLFGIIQILFFYMGDILLIYSMLSILLIAFFNAPNKIILASALLIFFIPAILESLQLLPDLSNDIKDHYSSDSIKESYQSGGLIAMMKARVTEYFYYDLTGITWNRTSFSMMLLGFWIGRNDYHRRFVEYKSKLKIIFGVCLLYYSAFILYFLLFNANFSFGLSMLYNVHILASIGVYSLGVFFIYHKFSGRLTGFLTGVGRTSLSNYILQSVICAFIFTSYGFSLFAKTTPTGNIIIVLSVYLFQITLTYFYLKKFRTGPLESLWQYLSYK